MSEKEILIKSLTGELNERRAPDRIILHGGCNDVSNNSRKDCK